MLPCLTYIVPHVWFSFINRNRQLSDLFPPPVSKFWLFCIDFYSFGTNNYLAAELLILCIYYTKSFTVCYYENISVFAILDNKVYYLDSGGIMADNITKWLQTQVWVNSPGFNQIIGAIRYLSLVKSINSSWVVIYIFFTLLHLPTAYCYFLSD